MAEIDGKKIALQCRKALRSRVQEFAEQKGYPPGLGVILVGEDPASAVYVRNKERAASEIDMLAEVVRLPAETTQAGLLDTLDRINADDRIHGMIVQLPLPAHLDEPTVIEAIAPHKDVDGLHPANIGRLVAGRKTDFKLVKFNGKSLPNGFQESFLPGPAVEESLSFLVLGYRP